ncbi:MAG: helix-turn-helix domain-containing protein [Prolixibacteraceae bacterium]|jgi:plasmid maintenance system antidote protein VapI|nr:helix-turn-helix domain-containing protein [Prolixibacteraceae bacterium]
MDSDIKLQKELLSPPGDTIKETLDTIGLSESEFAKRIGWTRERLDDLIVGNVPITIETARMLERELRITASFWMTREKNYRSDLLALSQVQN